MTCVYFIFINALLNISVKSACLRYSIVAVLLRPVSNKVVWRIFQCIYVTCLFVQPLLIQTNEFLFWFKLTHEK